MRANEYLQLVRKQIKYIFDRKSITEELHQHIQDSMADLISEGYSESEAENKAVEMMGDPIQTGKELNRQHHPMIAYLGLGSSVFLVLLLLPFSIVFLSAGANAFQLLTPITVDSCSYNVPVNQEIQMAQHTLKLDNLCFDEENQCTITYRIINKLSAIHSQHHAHLFDLTDSHGNDLSGSSFQSHGPIGTRGYQRFTLPNDQKIIVVLSNHEKIMLDCKEQSYDKK